MCSLLALKQQHGPDGRKDRLGEGRHVTGLLCETRKARRIDGRLNINGAVEEQGNPAWRIRELG